jgi:hypothetical protein
MISTCGVRIGESWVRVRVPVYIGVDVGSGNAIFRIGLRFDCGAEGES